MSSDAMAITARGLAKTYRIGGRPAHSTTAEALKHRLRTRGRSDSVLYEALVDVSFDVPRGQVLGVIGRNGAGKSTLLKILARVTPPTRGSAVIRGRVGSLLEVGTGFHPELTGRENVYLSGAVLGMSSREVRGRFDEIVDFAGVEQFLDTPVKHYSTGMQVRLAFAVAAHVSADVLLCDEVLAVGDQEFQQRSLAKMRSAATDGRTVLLVSHQLNTVAALCDAALYLDRGRVVEHGSTSEVIAAYVAAGAAHASSRDLEDVAGRGGSGEVRLVALAQEADGEIRLRWKLRCRRGTERVFVSVHLVDEEGRVVLQCDSRLVHSGYSVHASEEREGRFILNGPALKPGEYRVDFFVGRPDGLLDEVEDAMRVRVPPVLPYPYAAPPDASGNGLVLGDFIYE